MNDHLTTENKRGSWYERADLFQHTIRKAIGTHAEASFILFAESEKSLDRPKTHCSSKFCMYAFVRLQFCFLSFFFSFFHSCLIFFCILLFLFQEQRPKKAKVEKQGSSTLRRFFEKIFSLEYKSKVPMF
jgi:hypothetical protein